MKGGKREGSGRKKGGTNKVSYVVKDVYEALIGSFKSGKYYVYQHLYKNTIFYVGKGCNQRAWDSGSRNEMWLDFVNSIAKEYEVRIIAANLSEKEALAIEKALIEVHNPICNILLRG